jgi:hypothetical protein
MNKTVKKKENFLNSFLKVLTVLRKGHANFVKNGWQTIYFDAFKLSFTGKLHLKYSFLLFVTTKSIDLHFYFMLFISTASMQIRETIFTIGI